MVRYLHRRSKSAFEFLDLQPNVAVSPSPLLGTRQRSSSKPSCSHNNHIPIMIGMGVRQLWSYTTYQLLMTDSNSDCIVSCTILTARGNRNFNVAMNGHRQTPVLQFSCPSEAEQQANDEDKDDWLRHCCFTWREDNRKLFSLHSNSRVLDWKWL